MFDVKSNMKIAKLKALAEQDAGAANQLEINLAEEGDKGHYERMTDGLIIVDVTVVGTNGTLDIIVQDYGRDDKTWDADFCVVAQITATGVYAIPIKGIREKVRLRSTVGTAAITWGAMFIGLNAQRRPVKQSGASFPTLTYATNRRG